MTLLSIGGIISLLINSVLGLFVFFNDTRNVINRYFGFFSLSIAFWSVGSFLANINPEPTRALIILRFCYVAAVFLPAFYLHFITHVTELDKTKLFSIKLAYISSLLF